VNPFRAQVAGALEAMTVQPSGSWAWCGRRVARPPVHSLPPDAARAYRVAALQRVLYESFYCRGVPSPLPVTERQVAPRSDAAFVEQLSAANKGRGCWAAGWRIEARSGEGLLVRKEGLRMLVPPACARPAVGEPPDGDLVHIRLPKELASASPGYYTALGNTELRPESGDAMVRLYVHIVPSAAPKLTALVTSSLNDLGVAFRLKVVDAPEQYFRCDAAVLYTAAKDFGAVRPVLRHLCSGVQLRERTPAFTKALRPGIGLAEQPASGDSFGTDRCLLLAEGIVEAHDRGAKRIHERLAVVAAHFASRGVVLDAPYLEPGSNDRYAM
jgi:HopA1 effector protein family